MSHRWGQGSHASRVGWRRKGGGGKVKGEKWRQRKAQRVSYLLGENFERLYRVAHCIGFKKRGGKKESPSPRLVAVYVFSLAAAASAGVCMCVCICSRACMSERSGGVAAREGPREGCKK